MANIGYLMAGLITGWGPIWPADTDELVIEIEVPSEGDDRILLLGVGVYGNLCKVLWKDAGEYYMADRGIGIASGMMRGTKVTVWTVYKLSPEYAKSVWLDGDGSAHHYHSNAWK